MDIFTLIATIFGLIVLLAYVNHLYFKLQNTIAMMSGALLISATLILIQHLGIANISEFSSSFIDRTQFSSFLLRGILSFLLFAGAMSIDFAALKSLKKEIAILSSCATVASTGLIAVFLYYLMQLFSLHLPLIYCFLFGALISPTDPIAVIATFKHIGAPKSLSTCLAGESLFNDGVGIVIFTTVLDLLSGHTQLSWQHVAMLFLQQSVGGIAYGLLLGYLVNFLIRRSDDPKMTILITLMAVTTGYRIALALDISGALAMVVTGLIVGAEIRNTLKPKALLSVENFWELIDEILNAVLFLVMGFELLELHISGPQVIVALSMIPIILLVRMITVALPLKSLHIKRTYKKYTISILTWGGLRGGLAVALALSIPANNYRDLIIALTYTVVVFSVVIQGITIKPLARKAIDS